MNFDQLFRSLLSKHRFAITEALKKENVDLRSFLDFSQKRYVEMQRFNHHEFTKDKFTVDLANCKNLLDVIAELISLLEVPAQVQKSHAEIAWIQYSNDQPVTSANMDQIAKEYGWTSRHSGKKIKDQYQKLINDSVHRNSTKEKFS